jgi:hypothetical protein
MPAGHRWICLPRWTLALTYVTTSGFVDDGDIVTSAGISAGIDIALAPGRPPGRC